MGNEEYNKNDFELEEVKKFERTFSKVRTAGQIIVAAFIVAGLCGAFGYADWTQKKIQLSGNYDLEYERYLHAKREVTLKLRVNGNFKDSVIRVAFPCWYFEKMNIRYMVPRPEEALLETDTLAFKFKSIPESSGLIIFSMYPAKSGSLELGINVNGISTTVKQFIYP
jgi:hypothetical protein